MRSSISRMMAVLLCLALLIGFAPAGRADAPDPEIHVTGVSLNEPTLSLTVGEVETLIATVEPLDADDKTVMWSSNATTIATVSDSGEVTALQAGEATITVITVDGGFTGSCTVTVTAPAVIPVTGVSVAPATLSLEVGQAAALTATAAPSDASDKTVAWGSSDSSIAAVNASGTVTAVKRGTATITVTTTDGGFTDSCAVTVTPKPPAISPTSVSVEEGSAVILNLSNLPASASITSWVSSNSNIATVSGSSQATSGGTASATVTGRAAGSVTISASVAGVEQTLSCYVTVREKVGLASTFSYHMEQGEVLTFSSADFNSACRDVNGNNLSYLNFTLPSSSYGTLYYDYDENRTAEPVKRSTDYYYIGNNNRDYLSKVCFVPKASYSGTFNISYSAVDERGLSLTGTVKITVNKGEGSGKIEYRTDKNKAVTFTASDFNDLCRDENGKNVSSVRFTLPSSSRGVLYYGYNKNSTSNEEVSRNTDYYRSPGSRQKGISDVSFVPAKDSTGTTSIFFTGENVDGRSFSGTVVIYVGTDGGDVTYSAAPGKVIDFLAADFNQFCRDEINETLSYIQLTSPSSSKGVLYSDYRAGSKNNDEVSRNTRYYRAPGASQRGISGICFVPNNSNVTGTIRFDFIGMSIGGREVSGTVTLRYQSTATGSAGMISYSSQNGQAVPFRKNDFINACNNRGGAALDFVKFIQPASAVGTLYDSYVSPGNYGALVSPATSYHTNSGSASISNVTFVPAPGFMGTAVLSYTGEDEDGESYTGAVYVYVTSATVIFTDMGKHSWAAEAVSTLYQSGVVKGTSAASYGPGELLRRGDFVLMLSRAFQFTGTPAETFRDVPSGAYYAAAVHAAKAMGIALGENGYFRPDGSLTRQDAMVLIKRSLDVKGTSLGTSSALTLGAFPDAGAVSSYAREAVSALVAAGVVTGDNYGKLNPWESLTRAEMAVMLYRVLIL